MNIMGSDIPDSVLVQDDKMIGHTTNPVEVEEARSKIEYFRNFKGWLPRTMSIRQMGKKSNHGLNYKEGFKGFSLINEIQESEGKQIVNGYHKIYPKLQSNWYEAVKKSIFDERSIYDLFGNKYRFFGQFNDDLWKAAISCCPQATVGYLINKAILDIYNSNDPCLDEVDLLGQVHDSILEQMPVDDIPMMADAIIAQKYYLDPVLETHGREFVIETEMKIGWDWKNMIDVDISGDARKIEQNLIEGVQKLGPQTEITRLDQLIS
jgi:hypothetical protein